MLSSARGPGRSCPRAPTLALVAGVLLSAAGGVGANTESAAPASYVCYRVHAPLDIDGSLDESSWLAAPWTTDFVDIEGSARPLPPLRTRARMLWDDTYLYVGAQMQEPHLWATLTDRDSVVYHDNDFEVFIDPDGDTHAYYELEVNALGTVWDLMLIQPYRDGGPAIDAWDIRGLGLSVRIDGTLNDPRDTDAGWTVEMALPWEVLREAAPGRRGPRAGEQWRVNFSRVEWDLETTAGSYAKSVDPQTGDARPEHNWVWSPQGAIDMHRPEHWGYVQFSDVVVGDGAEAFVPDPDAAVKLALRALYYRQREYRERHGRYAGDLVELLGSTPMAAGLDFTPQLRAGRQSYEITAIGPAGTAVHILHDGRVWSDATANAGHRP